MFIIDDIFAIAALAIAGASTVAGAIQSNTANHRQRQADQSQRELTNYRAARERQDAIRAARMSYATAENNAANGGVSDSSGAQGGQGSIISQGNSGLGFLDNQLRFTNQTSSFLDSAAKHTNMANNWGAMAQLGFAGFDYFGSIQAPSAVNIPQIPQAKPPGSALPSYMRTGGM